MEFAGYIWDLGVIAAFIASAIALYSANKAKQAADNANEIASRNLSLTSELEIVRFREKWLADVRNQMATSINMLTTRPEHTTDKLKQIAELRNAITRLYLLLPHEDEETLKFMRTIRSLQEKFGEEGSAANPAEVIMLGKQILKREWTRIKTDLETINAKNK